MFFIIFMVISSLIMSVLMIVFGRMLKKNPPKKSMDCMDIGQHVLLKIWIRGNLHRNIVERFGLNLE